MNTEFAKITYDIIEDHEVLKRKENIFMKKVSLVIASLAIGLLGLIIGDAKENERIEEAVEKKVEQRFRQIEKNEEESH